MEYSVFIIPALAVILDGLFGDPKWLPHPVRLVGKTLDIYETAARKTGIDLKFAGWTAVILFAGISYGTVRLLMEIPVFGWLFGVYLAYAGLALGCLIVETRKVTNLVNTGALVEARYALAMLVSRDTSAMDADGIRRSLAETVSENLNDGFVAPLFYLCLFGPAGLWAYKAVSTMDSMWGYKTDQYRDLGQGGALTDDLMAFIPARLTAFILLFVGKMRSLNFREAVCHFRKDARAMESPNAGWPMATAAWLMDAQMGGPTVYFGKVKNKPYLGPEAKPWNHGKVQGVINLCDRAGRYAAYLFIPVLGIIHHWAG